MDLLKTRRQLDSGKTIFDLQLRVVYYARVSTDRDEQLNSLENQITYYDNFIKSNKNWTYCGGYVDEGISGTSVNKRDNFLKMISDASEDNFDLIITKEISRFSRSTLDSIKYTQELLDYGVCVFFQGDNINTIYSDSELRLTIMASLAQDEMRRLSERVKFGMKRAYESGKVLGQNNLYGYNKGGGKLEINEKEAEFVRDLFDLYATGKYGYRTVARMLTEKGYRSQVGKEINPASLKGILTNPKYKGYYHGRITETKDYKSKKSIALPEEDRLLYKSNDIPAIVSEELWDRVNALINKRTEKYKSRSDGTQSRFPYSGKVVCEEHQTYHYRKVWKERKIPAESWCCKEYLAKGRVACATPHIYTEALDAILETIGEDLISNKAKYQQSVDELLNLYKASEKGNVDYALEALKTTKEIEKIERKKRKVLDLYTEDDIDKEEYLSTTQMLKDDLAVLQNKLEQIKADEQSEFNISSTLNSVRKHFDELSKTNIPPLEVAQNMLDKVIVRKGSTRENIKLNIIMKYGDEQEVTVENNNHFVFGDRS